MIVETAISNSAVVKSFVRFLCNELKIKPKRIIVAELEDLESNTIGLCIDESEDEFIILVKENTRTLSDILITIAHEMIHVKQYILQDLGWFLDTQYNIPYQERWWEKEAFSGAVPLVEKYAIHLTIIQKNVIEREVFDFA